MSKQLGGFLAAEERLFPRVGLWTKQKIARRGPLPEWISIIEKPEYPRHADSATERKRKT